MDKAKGTPGRCIAMANPFGKESELYIKTRSRNGTTILEDSFFTAPFKVAKPFHGDEKGVLGIMVMVASAGIMEGDRYRINVELGEGARTALYGQSYNKIHRMRGGHARQFNQFFLEKEAFLDYAQKPTIPFAHSSFSSVSECHLKEGSAFLYSEILACGREKSGERFEFKEYRNCNKVYYKGELIFLDNQLLVPGFQAIEGIGFFEGYTHQASLAYFCDRLDYNLLERFYEILKDVSDIDFGLTKTEKFGIVVRILGNGGDYLERIFSCLRREIYKIL